ncbi:leucine-rich repeat and fibronectin type III domain-containing protein 1-like [Ptychodera flava]|uniref:leucine-rich repeat and fibronectin type III domain-containing protein 1-like n=1 Tax=Ptychodera flava TaxID=63121 RepID=UPI003969FB07
MDGKLAIFLVFPIIVTVAFQSAVVNAAIEVTSYTETTIAVNWTIPSDVDSSNITSYTITYDSKTRSVSGSTTYQITGLSSGTAYTVCYVIVLNDGSTNTPSGNCVIVYTTYDPMNGYAVAAIVIASIIVFVLILAKALEIILNPEEKKDKKAKALLEEKKRDHKVHPDTKGFDDANNIDYDITDISVKTEVK